MKDVGTLIAEIRERHMASPTFCTYCTLDVNEIPYPCDAIRLADALEEQCEATQDLANELADVESLIE